MQSKNRDTDIENKHVDSKKGKGSGMNWEIGIDIYTPAMFSNLSLGDLHPSGVAPGLFKSLALWWLPGVEQREEMGICCLMGMELQVRKVEEALEIDGGDGQRI